MSVLNVGSGQQYSTLASAIAAAKDGDTIDVQAGTYTNDFAIITHNITIEGVGGMVDLVATQSPPNGKAILTTDANVTIENVTFSGASVPDGNGAGIRYETGNLVLNNDVFKNNQEGLLAADDPQGSITITNSTFTHNGKGDGQTHNLYVGDIGTLTIDHSTFTDAVVGHEIKSRAETTIIENSLIADGPTGSASYSIDLPNGGNATIKNNVIEQGPETQNPTIIAFGEEGNVHAGSSLTITGNTIVNDLAKPDAQLLWNATGATASLAGNEIYGLTPGQLGSGIAESGTTYLASEPALVLPADVAAPVAAEPPVLSASVADASIAPGASVGLAITATAAAAGEHAPSVTITGIPDGASLTDAAHDTLAITGGAITLTQGELDGLTLTTSPAFTGTISLTVTATDTEAAASATSDPQVLTVTVEAASPPGPPAPPSVPVTPADPVPPTDPAPPSDPSGVTAAAPELHAAFGAQHLGEDGWLRLHIHAAPADPADQAPSVTITGLPDGTRLVDAHHDTLAITDGAITLDAGALKGLALKPPPGFTGALTLGVTATDTEPSTGTSASSPTDMIHLAMGGQTPGHPAAPDWLLQALGEPTHAPLREILGALAHDGHEGGPLTLAHILPQGQHVDFVPHQ